MTLADLIRRLKEMGFVEAGKGAYRVTTRLTHPTVRRASLFVGDRSPVRFCGTADLDGDGPFIIANGRTTGMTLELLQMDDKPTGTIRDPKGRPKKDDDPYWRGDGPLLALLIAMKGRFSR